MPQTLDRRLHRLRLVLLLSMATATAATAQKAPASRHDHHEDPVAEHLGSITWPTSASAAAHALFIRGVLYMHNFHYDEAAEVFREAQKKDVGDVMSYWGEAMSYTHPVWNEQDTTAARGALRRLAPTRAKRLARARTPRERAWLDAAETLYDGDTPKARRDTLYAAAMQRLHADRPNDPEAATFYALALLGLNQGERDTVTYARAYAIVDSVFTAYPEHPGAAHYLIHAVDDPDHAQLGLQAAKKYSQIASSAGHALHMTSHIFMALGMWDDVVTANERSQATVPTFVIPHAVTWLGYGLLQQGRYREAERWIDSIYGQAKSAKRKDIREVSMGGTAELVASWNASTDRWRDRPAMIRVDTANTDVTTAMLGTALGALGRGDRVLADSMLRAIVVAMRDDSVRLARLANAQPGDLAWHGVIRIRERTVRAMLLRAAGQRDSAVALLRAASAIEQSLPVDFGPPTSFKPPHEATGDVLLEMSRYADAEAEYRLALARTPRRSQALLGLARALKGQGKTEEAGRTYAELVEIWARADDGLAEVAEARAAAKKS
jgi:tetratricopeptide (TPR) repeat protein